MAILVKTKFVVLVNIGSIGKMVIFIDGYGKNMYYRKGHHTYETYIASRNGQLSKKKLIYWIFWSNEKDHEWGATEGLYCESSQIILLEMRLQSLSIMEDWLQQHNYKHSASCGAIRII